MKKNILDIRMEASHKFNPHKLCHYLVRTEDGNVIVDRQRILQNQDDIRLFYVTLNADYLWNYYNPEEPTIYFEIADDGIIGGVYDYNLGKQTKRLIATVRDGELSHHYKYSQDVLNEMISLIQHT